MVSWPMRSSGVKAAFSTFSMRQALGRVGEVGRFGVQQGVVVATAQLQRHFAGDGARHPALGGFAQHHGLGVEPAALVEQAAQLQAVDAVLLNGVFIVDAGDQALVSNVQQGHARGFVDAARSWLR